MRSPVNSLNKGQWRGALICVWINDWVNNREAGDLRRYRAHYDVIVMSPISRNALLACIHCIEVRRVTFLNTVKDLSRKNIVRPWFWFRKRYHSQTKQYSSLDSTNKRVRFFYISYFRKRCCTSKYPNKSTIIRYCVIIGSTLASQITGVSIVCSAEMFPLDDITMKIRYYKTLIHCHAAFLIKGALQA